MISGVFGSHPRVVHDLIFESWALKCDSPACGRVPPLRPNSELLDATPAHNDCLLPALITDRMRRSDGGDCVLRLQVLTSAHEVPRFSMLDPDEVLRSPRHEPQSAHAPKKMRFSREKLLASAGRRP